MSLRDLESIFREEETGEQIAIAALVQRPVLLSRGQVGVTAALLRWAMLPQLPGKSIVASSISTLCRCEAQNVGNFQKSAVTQRQKGCGKPGQSVASCKVQQGGMVPCQTLFSNGGAMTRTSQEVSYRQALLDARLQKVVNLRKAREACGECVREKRNWVRGCLPDTLQHGGGIFKLQLTATEMRAVNDEGSRADGRAAEEGRGKFHLQQVRFQPLGVEQGEGGVVQGEGDLQGGIFWQAHLQADLDFRLALAHFSWKQPPSSLLWLLLLLQQVDHLDSNLLLPPA